MESERPQVNWTEIARAVGALEKPGGESGSTAMARSALELLLGPDFMRDTVDFYISQRPGSETARHVLWLLHPWSAMLRCYEIYKTAASQEDRVTAVELLRVVADSRAVPWISEFLRDPDEGVQVWGVGVLDQLLWRDLIDEVDCAALLAESRGHANPQVRERAAFIDEYLSKWRQRGEPGAATSLGDDQ